VNGRGPLYLDHNASTPPYSEVVEAMLPWLRDQHANPHSDHFHGRLAADAIEQAKQSIAQLIGASRE
jgi:cysteine desulfurase